MPCVQLLQVGNKLRLSVSTHRLGQERDESNSKVEEAVVEEAPGSPWTDVRDFGLVMWV